MPDFHFMSRVKLPDQSGVLSHFIDVGPLVIETSYEEAMRRNLVQEASRMALGRHPQALSCATLSAPPAVEDIEAYLISLFKVSSEDIWRTNYNPLDPIFEKYERKMVQGKTVFIQYHERHGFIEYALAEDS